MKILVAIPYTSHVPATAAYTLMPMMSFTEKMGVSISQFTAGMSLVYIAREEAVKLAIKDNYDYLMFIDSDMVVPVNLITRLLSHKKPIVSGLAFKRVPDHEPCIFKSLDPPDYYYDYPQGLVEVAAVGMACTLIDCNVLKALPPPWFLPEGKLGEDMIFCKRASDKGFKSYCDTTMVVGHVGEKVIYERDYLNRRKKMLSVIIPFCPDGGRRDVNYDYCTARLRAMYPKMEIIQAMQEQPPFSRSMTCNIGAKMAKNDILLFMDADAIFDKDLIENGLDIVRNVPWVAPMTQKWDITWADSNKLLNAPPDIELKGLNLNIHRKWGAERCRGGFMMMITKENFFKAGGFDERFCGWGFEDNALMLTLESTVGSYAETDNIAYHLWHPFAGNQFPENTQKNRELYAEYFKHYEKGDLMQWVEKTGHTLKSQPK